MEPHRVVAISCLAILLVSTIVLFALTMTIAVSASKFSPPVPGNETCEVPHNSPQCEPDSSTYFLHPADGCGGLFLGFSCDDNRPCGRGINPYDPTGTLTSLIEGQLNEAVSKCAWVQQAQVLFTTSLPDFDAFQGLSVAHTALTTGIPLALPSVRDALRAMPLSLTIEGDNMRVQTQVE